MHCIVLSSPEGPDRWRIWRSVEILGYHSQEKEVRILFGLLVENLVYGSNSLRILHRGEVECRVLCPWPLPKHADEDNDPAEEGALRLFYSQGFEERKGRIYHIESLTSWCEWRKVPHDKQEEVYPWPNPEFSNLTFGQLIPPDSPSQRPKFCAPPFTTWALGPFPHRGFYLLAFSLVFREQTYRDLVERSHCFSIDGPNRLLSAIKYRDFLKLQPDEKTVWEQHLADFAAPEKRLTSDSYDVIILGSGLADNVAVVTDTENSSGIYQAPPKAGLPDDRDGQYQRFVTTDDNFTLPVVFSPVHSAKNMAAVV